MKVLVSKYIYSSFEIYDLLSKSCFTGVKLKGVTRNLFLNGNKHLTERDSYLFGRIIPEELTLLPGTEEI